MTQRNVHRAFGWLTVTLAVLLAFQTWRWAHAQQASTRLNQVATAPVPDNAASSASTPGSDVPLLLAQATQLRRLGRLDDAVRLLQTLAARTDIEGVAALTIRYNLANALLVMALQSNTRGDEDRALTLVELSKQRYREVLRASPDDWDARHNLERALRLAPENEPIAEAEKPTNVQRIQVELRGIRAADLP